MKKEMTLTINVNFEDDNRFNDFKSDIMAVLERYKPVESTNATNQNLSPKDIGKMVTDAFRTWKLETSASAKFTDVCIYAGLGRYESCNLGDIIEIGNFKRLGKKVAWYLKLGDMNDDLFLEGFNKLISESDNGCCCSSNCGCNTFECPRCGTTNNKSTDECSHCGLFFISSQK